MVAPDRWKNNVESADIYTDGMVLIDYKTDHVSDGEILVKRYKVQLDYYQRALEQMTGKRVKERIIYSLALQKEILC